MKKSTVNCKKFKVAEVQRQNADQLLLRMGGHEEHFGGDTGFKT